MSEQEKRAQRRKQEDAAFNKMLLWLAGCVALEGLTLLLRQIYLNFSYDDLGFAVAGGVDAFFGVFRFVGAVLTLVGCVWLFVSYQRQGKRGKRLILPLVCTGVVAWLWIASVLCHGLNETGMGLLCMLPVAIAVLALVFFLYQREFFYNSVLGGVGLVALWVFRKIYEGHPTLTICGFVAVWVAMAAAAFFAFKLSGWEGMAGHVRILPAGANYVPIFLTCAVVAAALLAALLIGVASAYYIMFVVIGWLFCLAVYYTVKLM